MKLFVNGTTQHVGNRPVLAKTPTDGIVRYSCDFSPFCYGQAAPFQFKNPVVSSVSRLFFCDYPPAVVGRVAFFIVEAIQRVVRRGTSAHVFEKRLKGIFPACAHKNLAASVAVVAGILWIVATLNHSYPRPIFSGVTHSMLGIDTATASSMPAMQIPRKNDRDISANAAAAPSATVEFVSGCFKDRESSEFLSGEITKTHAGIIPQGGMHRGFLI